MGGEDLAGVEGDDRHLLLVDDGQDPLAGMGRADVQVVQAAGPAQGDRALAVGGVVAEAEVAWGAAPCRMRLGARGIGLGRGDAPGRPVRPVLVVGEAEPVELRLELAERARSRLALEPALQGLLEALDLAWVWGWPGAPFFWRMPRYASRYSNPFRPPVKRDV